MKKLLLVPTALLLLASLAPAQEEPRVRVYYIPAASMEPTLNINDRVVTTPLPYQKGDPKRGDIAILHLLMARVAPWSDEANKTVDFVKRVVAVPGDRVEIVKRVLKINGKIQKEPFVKWEDNFSYDMKVVNGKVFSREYDSEGLPGHWTRMGEMVPEPQQTFVSRAQTGALPATKYLVLGDNRSNSNDSHIFGLVDRSVFIAKVTMRLYPNTRTFN